jgi:hypothetical protein
MPLTLSCIFCPLLKPPLREEWHETHMQALRDPVAACLHTPVSSLICNQADLLLCLTASLQIMCLTVRAVSSFHR